MLINLEHSGNILASNDYNVHFSSFLLRLQAKDARTRVLAYLVMHALIKQLSGEHQIEAARNILDVIGSAGIYSFDNLSADSDNVLEVRLRILLSE
jgi:U3 small nucleolar RNA-associated protein 10